MDSKKLFVAWLYVAVLAAAFYVIYHGIEKAKYYNGIKNLGFGEFWLSQLKYQELKDLYTYIYDFTQKGKMPEVGSGLDLRLVELSKKYPVILNYK
jgi:hypothetical protein